MKVKDYRDLIEKGEEIRNKMQRFISSSEYRKTNDYDIDGYTIEDIDNFVRVATNIIENVDIK